MKKLVFSLLKQKNFSSDIISRFKRQWAKKAGAFPKNSEIFVKYKELVKDGKIKPNKAFEKAIRLKKIRSLSGIVPVAVLTKPYTCPGKCIYCPTQKNMPKSYLDDEPAVMRAKRVNFDPYEQVRQRLKQLKATGHSIQKIELIILGGTFSSLTRDYQVEFISQCFAAANKSKKLNFRNHTLSSKLKILNDQQRLNETSQNRIIGITLETRPDLINQSEIIWMRKLGATRVEIGIQSIYNSVLNKVKRGHRVRETIKATKLLKSAGFKVCYHIMSNLPGSSIKKDLTMFKKIFSDEKFMPDMIKIYPCVVLYQAELYEWFKKGRFKPYPDNELIDLLIKIKQIVPAWVRIMRLGRDIPIGNIAAGNKLSNIRQVLQEKMKKKNIKCNCIRCREIRTPQVGYNILIYYKRIKYKASNCTEYFLSFNSKKGDKLLSLLRLRIPEMNVKESHFIPVLRKSGIIRELHTYGESLPIAKNEKGIPQHKGLGKQLISKAERICREKGIKKIAVIAGVGTREYYRRLDYRLKDTYMVKNLSG